MKFKGTVQAMARREPKAEKAKKPALPLERDYLSDIEDNLRAAGAIVVRLNAGVARSLDSKRIIRLAGSGMPDLLVILPDRVVFLEVKRPVSGKVSPVQKKMISRLQDMNQTVAVVRSVEEALAACGIRSIFDMATSAG